MTDKGRGALSDKKLATERGSAPHFDFLSPYMRSKETLLMGFSCLEGSPSTCWVILCMAGKGALFLLPDFEALRLPCRPADSAFSWWSCCLVLFLVSCPESTYLPGCVQEAATRGLLRLCPLFAGSSHCALPQLCWGFPEAMLCPAAIAVSRWEIRALHAGLCSRPWQGPHQSALG